MRWAIALALAGLIAVWQVIPAQSPAIYDGVCSPDPYRYVVNNPPGVPAPAPASQIVPLAGGEVPTIQLIADDNNDPQAQILVLAGSIKLPAGTQAVKLTITPLAPPSIQPAGGHVDGNMYEFEITTDSGAPVVLSESPTIVLRGTSTDSSGRSIAQFDGTKWTSLKSTSVGCADTLEAPALTLGKFAIIATGSAASGTGTAKPAQSAAPNSQFPWTPLILALALLAFGGWQITRTRRSGRR
jgi:hypothetical protein